VDLTTGKLKWHFQTVPNDNWDFDGVQQFMLLDLRIDGRVRKVLTESAAEEDWLLETLLKSVVTGKLQRVIIVTAGNRWPTINKWEWEHNAHLLDDLPKMNAGHIKIYAEDGIDRNRLDAYNLGMRKVKPNEGR
jgi:hypothetical protein